MTAKTAAAKDTERVPFPSPAPTLTITGPFTFKLIHDFDRYANGSMLMKISDCMATFDDGNGLTGAVGAAIGATIFVQVGGRTWTLKPDALVEAVIAAEKALEPR